jgi:general stress protein 26
MGDREHVGDDREAGRQGADTRRFATSRRTWARPRCRKVRRMSDATLDATLDEVKSFATSLSPWAHLASVGADQAPDVVPIHPAWEGDTLWAMVGAGSVKARNIEHNPQVALHWQVTENGDGVELWGTASVHTDVETKRRLWTGVFDYNLSDFAPGGPDDSPDTGFIAVQPSRALILLAYGMKGMRRWRAKASA